MEQLVLKHPHPRFFDAFLEKLGCDPNQFRGVLMNSLPKNEDVAEKNIFIYDIEIEDVDFVGELARRKIGKYEKRIKLLRYNNHIIHVNNIYNFFKCFRCPRSFNLSQKFNKHLLRCKNGIKTFTLKKFTFYKRGCLKNWMGSILSIPK